MGSLTTDMIAERNRAESIVRDTRAPMRRTSVSLAVRDGVVVGARFHFCGDEYRIVGTTGDAVTATCGQFGTPQRFKRADVARALRFGNDLSPVYQAQADQREHERNLLGFKRQVSFVDRPRYVERATADGHDVVKIGGTWPRRDNVDATIKRPVVDDKTVTVSVGVDGRIAVAVTCPAKPTPAQKALATKAANRRAQGYGTYDPSIGD